MLRRKPPFKVMFIRNLSLSFILFLGLCSVGMALAQPPDSGYTSSMAGRWVINESLSDNSDKQVEATLKAMGQKVKRCFFNCEKDRYRGGPEEHELYDRLSYDRQLQITLEEPKYLFVYEDNYQRPVYTDGRSQSVSLTGLDEVEDFSFAYWENDTLLVEARPRDGGFTMESYHLSADGMQLTVALYIQPFSFTEPIELNRVYDRAGSQ